MFVIDALIVLNYFECVKHFQVAERLGNWASNQKVAGSLPGSAK